VFCCSGDLICCWFGAEFYIPITFIHCCSLLLFPRWLLLPFLPLLITCVVVCIYPPYGALLFYHYPRYVALGRSRFYVAVRSAGAFAMIRWSCDVVSLFILPGVWLFRSYVVVTVVTAFTPLLLPGCSVHYVWSCSLHTRYWFLPLPLLRFVVPSSVLRSFTDFPITWFISFVVRSSTVVPRFVLFAGRCCTRCWTLFVTFCHDFTVVPLGTCDYHRWCSLPFPISVTFYHVVDLIDYVTGVLIVRYACRVSLYAISFVSDAWSAAAPFPTWLLFVCCCCCCYVVLLIVDFALRFPIALRLVLHCSAICWVLCCITLRYALIYLRFVTCPLQTRSDRWCRVAFVYICCSFPLPPLRCSCLVDFFAFVYDHTTIHTLYVTFYYVWFSGYVTVAALRFCSFADGYVDLHTRCGWCRCSLLITLLRLPLLRSLFRLRFFPCYFWFAFLPDCYHTFAVGLRWFSLVLLYQLLVCSRSFDSLRWLFVRCWFRLLFDFVVAIPITIVCSVRCCSFALILTLLFLLRYVVVAVIYVVLFLRFVMVVDLFRWRWFVRCSLLICCLHHVTFQLIVVGLRCVVPVGLFPVGYHTVWFTCWLRCWFAGSGYRLVGFSTTTFAVDSCGYVYVSVRLVYTRTLPGHAVAVDLI